MNIKEAKEEIKRTLKAYTGAGMAPVRPIPVSKQRPVLLIGPPGIGKTAIMEQIAQEMNAGLVSYTMTHHTRQSAIGLPYLREESFQDETFQVTEYTMSEIIASVYKCIRTTGCRYGILFLDEINCVSETLMPVMLQLLQCKMFGTHRIPDNWIIAAAGNPPEYNRSARAFDMATLDRVRKIEIEADYTIWHDYAAKNAVHPAILSYLAVHPDSFYTSRLETGSHSFVTARGWEDLSCLLLSYEELGEPVSEDLIRQFLQHEEIARDFSLYYRIFLKYREEFSLPKLLDLPAKAPVWQERLHTFAAASIDEGLAITALIRDFLFSETAKYSEEKADCEQLSQHIRALCGLIQPTDSSDTASNAASSFSSTAAAYLRSRHQTLNIRLQNGLSSPAETDAQRRVLKILETVLLYCNDAEKSPAELLQQCEQKLQRSFQDSASRLSRRIDQTYRLLLSRGPEDICLLHLTTDLSRNEDAAAFLYAHPCKAYLDASRNLLYS